MAIPYVFGGIVLLLRHGPGTVTASPDWSARGYDIETVSVTMQHVAGYFALGGAGTLVSYYVRVRNNGGILKSFPIFPADRIGWWRYAFSTFETVVVCMCVRTEQLYSIDTRLQYPPAFYIIFLSAMVALLVVCIVIRRTYRLHSWVGCFTLVVVFIILLLMPEL
jgi:hypothetical protein